MPETASPAVRLRWVLLPLCILIYARIALGLRCGRLIDVKGLRVLCLTRLWKGLLALSLLFGFAPVAVAELRVSDLTGREVVLEAPARRIVLAEARHMAVLGLLHDDPVALVAGWRQDKALDAPTLAAYRARFPAIDAIAPVGGGQRDLSAEAVLGLDPDLLVLSMMDAHDPASTRVRELAEAAGIAVVYVDFFAKPLENSLKSLEILGTLTGASARAAEFSAFYAERLSRIRSRLDAAAPARPRVFFHVHASPQGCCATVGQGVFHEFITAAGGQNLGSDLVQGVLGTASLEWLIAAQPDVYIATGGAHMAARGGLVLGSDVAPEAAAQSFAALLNAPGLQALEAVAEGRAAGVWHLFNDSPVHIALIEYLAKRFHPDLFADLNPDATLAEIDARFAPVSVPGTWWVAP